MGPSSCWSAAQRTRSWSLTNRTAEEKKKKRKGAMIYSHNHVNSQPRSEREVVKFHLVCLCSTVQGLHSIALFETTFSTFTAVELQRHS